MQRALMGRIPPSCHLFDNVMSVFGNEQAAYDTLASMKLYDAKLQWASEAPVSTLGWCVQHMSACNIQTGGACRVGGFPCQDFSRAGKQQKEAGKQSPLIVAFGQKAKLTANPVLVIENVDTCPSAIVHNTFGTDYNWHAQAVFSPMDVGFECTQRRRLGAKQQKDRSP